MASITLHLTAADGAVFDLSVTLPAARPPASVRVSSVVAVSVASVMTWDGTEWLT